MIRVQNLNKYYNKGKNNEIHVIDNTTVTLPDTGLVCILGESGSGKTTLMNTISGLDDFANGEITVDDITVKKFGDKNQEQIRNEKFGYIFQNYYLLRERTVEYNMLLGLSLYEIPEEEKQERIDYVLRQVGMWKYKKRLVSELSGGQQQRVAIARALSKSPNVIFADEPTGNLDEANTMKIMGILKKISRQCLVVLVTHEKAVANFFADEILWIANGRLSSTEDRKKSGTYEYVEATDLYLGEYEKTVQEQGNVRLEVYGNQEIPELNVKLIFNNGKYYLQAENADLVYLDGRDEKRMLEGKKPVVKQEDLEENDFSLPHIQGAKRPKMTVREIMETGKSNLKAFGKKQLFLALTLFAVAVLLAVTVQDMAGLMKVSEQELVSTDSRYYKVSVEKNDMMSNQELSNYFASMIDALQEKGYEPTIVPNVRFTYQYQGFEQLAQADYQLKNYFLADIGKVKKEDLIYGRMPENDEEIVADVWLLENFMESSEPVKNAIGKVKNAVGSTITTDKGIQLTIVGISQTKQPDLYLAEDMIVMLSGGNVNFRTESKAKQLFSDFEEAGLEINDDQTVQLLVPESELQKKYLTDMVKLGKKAEELQDSEEYKDYSYTGLLTDGVKYEVAGYFPDRYDIDYIIADDACSYIAKVLMNAKKCCYVSGLKEGDAKSLIEEAIPSAAKGKLVVQVENEYREAVDAYLSERAGKVGVRVLLTITVVVISMVILYFMMKANAISRMQDLGVYRMLGISKAGITGMFAYENFLLTSMTSLPGVILAVFTTYVIGKIPNFGGNYEASFPLCAGLLIGIYLMNIFIGVLPVRKMLKLPPAQLASKYDI